MGDYPDPVSRLITYGDCRILKKTALQNEWPDYLFELNIGQEHIPDLIRMVQDDRFDQYPSDNVAVWAPVHAWRILGQLRSVESIAALINTLKKDDDYTGEDLPKALGMIGFDAIQPLKAFLRDTSIDMYPRINAAVALEEIGKCHPNALGDAIAALSEELTRYSDHDPTLNAFLILSLTKLNATSEIDVIRDAYNNKAVNITILGDLEDAEIILGIRSVRDTPKPDYRDPKVRKYFDKITERVVLLANGSTGSQKTEKVGRNDPCPCGSGKKFKRCCLQ